MGFFLSPRASRKKKNAAASSVASLDELAAPPLPLPLPSSSSSSSASPSSLADDRKGTTTTTSANGTSRPPTLGAPPLFDMTRNDDSEKNIGDGRRRYLLKHLKGTSSQIVRRNSINSDSSLGKKLPTTMSTASVLGDTSSTTAGTNNFDGHNSLPARAFHHSFSVGSPLRNVRTNVAPFPEIKTPTKIITTDDGGDDNSNTSLPSLVIDDEAPPTTTNMSISNSNNCNNNNHNNNNQNDSNASITVSPLTPGTPSCRRSVSQLQQQQQQQQQLKTGSVGSTRQSSTGDQQQNPLLILSPPLHHSRSSVLSSSNGNESYSLVEEMVELEDEEYVDGDDDHEEHREKDVAVLLNVNQDYEYIEEVLVLEEEGTAGTAGGADGGGGVDGSGQRSRTPVIRFDEYDEIQMTIHLNDYSEKEIRKNWYCREDYDGMILESRHLVQKEENRIQQQQREEDHEQKRQEEALVPAANTTTTTEFETRGLEAWSIIGAQHVREVKEAAIEAVWDEQHRQWEAGIVDGEEMKNVYQRISLEAQRIANERALADQLVAEKIRQLDELGSNGGEFHKRRLRKTSRQNGGQGTSRRGRLLLKSRSLLGKSVKAAAGKMTQRGTKNGTSDATGAAPTTQSISPRMFLLQSIKMERKRREAARGASEMERRIIYRQPSASARAMKEAGALSNDSHDDDSHSTEEVSMRFSKPKLLGMVMGAKSKRNFQSGCATWEREAGLVAEGKL